MKKLFFVFALFVLFICACESSVPKQEPVSAKPSTTGGTPNNGNDSNSSSSNEVARVERVNQSELDARNEKFKIIPEHFKQIDFKNLSYPYRTWNGKNIKFTLNNGEYESDSLDNKGWYSFQDAFFVDLTNDGQQEAIVIISHVLCGGSCDGGAALFYVYSVHSNALKSIWQFETGSLAYGCGLKSLTVKNRKLSIEMFGRCPGAERVSLTGKFQVKDTTRLTLGFNGRKFVEESRQIISVPVRSVMNYVAEISIEE